MKCSQCGKLINKKSQLTQCKDSFQAGVLQGMTGLELPKKVLIDFEELWKEAIKQKWAFNWHTFKKFKEIFKPINVEEKQKVLK